MAFSVHWYDLLCFALLSAALAASLSAILERSCKARASSLHHRLLSAGEDGGGGSGSDSGGEEAGGDVLECELWMSQWRPVHPACLLGVRLAAAATMIGVLIWDLRTYDWSIMLYYTEYGNGSVAAPSPMAVGEAEQGLGYWLRWQVPVCLVVLAVPASVSVSAISSSRADPLRSSDLWLSCWKKVLLLDGVFAFYFYTQWTFLLLIIYFLIASVISAYGCWMYGKCAAENDKANAFHKGDVAVDISEILNATNRNKNASKSHGYYERGYYQQKAGFWGSLMLIAYQASAGAVVLTDIVFWALLVPFLSVAHFKLDLLMGCMHTLNLIFLLLDTTLNSLPFPWFRMAYFILWSCIYVIFQWILHACGFSWWPYPFLELSTPWAPLWYLCLGLVHIPCYGIYTLIVSVKNSLFSRIFRHAYRRS